MRFNPSRIIVSFWALLSLKTFSSRRVVVDSFVLRPVLHHHPDVTTTRLYLAKRKAAPKKIQVKLTKHIAGTGQAGDVIQVTPAFYNNRLLPTQSARIISAEEMEEERRQAAQETAATTQKAQEIKKRVEQTKLRIARKAGPNGQLFGGVGAKTLMEELHRALEDDFLKAKQVKIASLVDGDGKKVRGDLKHTGEFQATVKLTPEFSANLAFTIEAADT